MTEVFTQKFRTILSNHFLDEYLTINVLITKYNYYGGEGDKVKESSILTSNVEFNSNFFIDLLEQCKHKENLSLLEITQILEELQQKINCSEDVGFGNVSYGFNYKYTQLFGCVGEMKLFFTMSIGDEFGQLEYEEIYTVTLNNVIYKNHKYYAYTKKFHNWLEEDNKPNRKKIYQKLHYQK